jgi:uncharacterized CHY-type Zn-finger protein
MANNISIYGNTIDNETRCQHYQSDKDIIAIKMHCCNKYYACITCHNEKETHTTSVWPKENFNTAAILCGVCKTELSIENYLAANNNCPNCQAAFNPKCSNHYHLYFEQ